ncbi:MAG: tRNA (adenine-N1)-methyltransferase [Actinomycetales bacterium]|nr:tRNA (adenine-N1)-methyltransferase [Actinomycetales bacterium]
MTTNNQNWALPTGPFRAGDRVQLTGPKGRMATVTLTPGGRYGTHRGDVMHDEIIGKPEGSVILNQQGIEYLAFRPLLADFVLSMPRGAAIVYPKDSAQIVTNGDIFPGARVVEAGVGSGALSMYLLRAIGQNGTLDSFERRAEFAEIAEANVRTNFGVKPENWNVHLGDLQDELPKKCAAGTIDRVVLDMLAPWECIDVAADALVPGGVLIAYVATVTQLSRFTEALRDSELFAEPVAWESMVRDWHLQGLAVRPEHRMIAHTAFLVMARRMAPGAVMPHFKTRNKPEFTDEDLSAWNPEHMGQKKISDKKLRKSIRSATAAAEARADRSDELGE